MKIRNGDMFQESRDNFILITTNRIIKRDGKLVMGAGAAKQARDSMEGIDKFFGDMITSHPHPDTYGIILGNRFGAFQVKHHFKDEANLDLIRNSLQTLKVLSNSMPLKTFSVNFPGIGNGKLSYEDVIAVIEPCGLSDNITFWTK